MMEQQISKLASKEDVKKGEGLLQLGDLKSADASTGGPERAADTPKGGVAEGSGQAKFYESMTSFIEVMKEKESGGSVFKWDRKAPVIKAETPKQFMTVIIDLERLFSELGYKTQRKR